MSETVTRSTCTYYSCCTTARVFGAGRHDQTRFTASYTHGLFFVFSVQCEHRYHEELRTLRRNPSTLLEPYINVPNHAAARVYNARRKPQCVSLACTWLHENTCVPTVDLRFMSIYVATLERAWCKAAQRLQRILRYDGRESFVRRATARTSTVPASSCCACSSIAATFTLCFHKSPTLRYT